MKDERKPLIDISKIPIDRTLKSHANDPFVRRKVEEAKRVLAPYLKELAEQRELAEKQQLADKSK